MVVSYWLQDLQIVAAAAYCAYLTNKSLLPPVLHTGREISDVNSALKQILKIRPTDITYPPVFGTNCMKLSNVCLKSEEPQKYKYQSKHCTEPRAIHHNNKSFINLVSLSL